jgi:hypothetical protein
MFKKYKIEKIDNLYYVKRRKFPFKWVTVETYINKHQAECALIRIDKTRNDIVYGCIFTHYCSVKPTNKEHVIYNLKKMGYIPNLTFDFEAKYWYTSQSGLIYSTNNDNVERLTPNIYDNLYGIYCCDNDDIFLAIAAINDRNDYMQWFYNEEYDYNGNRLPDHQFMCDQDTLERFGWVNNSPNTYKSDVHYKMDVESIIKMFYEKAIKETIK